ncbi:hypothetical protein EAH79_16100 [Sphingomonas koreensis]|nr:hypothetical protein EAH87_06250 [Sphingomonas koreensis]TPG38637.1 hypothetical protein EAH79_16100 [Sphingomonas koreensis]
MRTVPLLFAPLWLAACGGASDHAAGNDAAATAGMNEQQQAAAEHRAPDPAKVMADRWQTLFTQPAKVIAAANEFGYKLGDFAPAKAGTGYAATGTEQTLPAADAPATVKTSVTAEGDSADHLQAVTFVFDTHVTGNANSPKVRETLGMPRQIVNGFLSRFELNPGDPIVAALTKFTSATVSRSGATITVDTKPGATAGPAADQHIIVTIAPSPAPAASASN